MAEKKEHSHARARSRTSSTASGSAPPRRRQEHQSGDGRVARRGGRHRDAKRRRRRSPRPRRRCPAWRRTPAPRRGEILARAAVEMHQRKDELARALTLEEGKTLGESLGEVQKAINNLEFQSGEGRRLNGETIPSELPSTFCWTQREPLGVVALVTPWNFPVAIPVWKLAPALVCGNTVVLKPASITPWTAKIIAEIFDRGGAAAGACSTSSSGPARRWARRWSSIPTSRRSRSPARTRSAPSSTPTAPRASRRCSARWAARTRSSCSRTPISSWRRRRPCRARSARPGSAAPRPRARSWSSSVAAEFTKLVVEKARALKVGDGTAAGRQRRARASTRGSSRPS